MKVRELEYELKHVQKVIIINNRIVWGKFKFAKTIIIQVANTSLRDDLSDGHQKAEVVRARQDMMNRIIQMEEKVQRA